MIALLILALLAGCAGPTPQDCADCVTGEIGLGLDGPQGDVRWETCEGVVGNFQMPRSALQDRIPPAFELADANAALGNVVFEALRCDRVVGASAITTEAALFHAYVRVRPTNASWASDYPSRYSLDLLAVGTELAPQMALEGIEAVPAQLRTQTVGLNEEWTFEASAAQATVVFTGGGSDSSAEVVRHVYLWFGAEDGQRRVAVDKTYRYGGLAQQAGILRLDGDLETAQGMPACCPVWDGQRFAHSQEIWSVTDALFVA